MTNTSTKPIQSVQWHDGKLILLDQRMLPLETNFVTLQTSEQVWEAIHSLTVRGAPAIGITAAYGLALAAEQFVGDNFDEFKHYVHQQQHFLTSARPTAVNLTWALERLVSILQAHNDITEAKSALLKKAHEIQREDEHVCRSIGEHAFLLFNDGDRILTHCNAGGIATAKYGTALAPFYIAKERGVHYQIFASETRPVLQGARLTTWELQQAGIDVTLITDNMVAHTIKTKNINAIIVGADRIAANGDTANKIGTFGLALIAKALNIPFYVAAPLSTIDLQIRSGDEIPIEERQAREVTHWHDKAVAPDGTQVFNPAFDITPHHLISAIITEKGIIHDNFEAELHNLFENTKGAQTK
ncbi:S-methyl-5-thioribose-1-phosphate isomerase [Bacillus solimangrovi]|uniref:Methylthioribose-1-phosphate isomerase n=1 Tax=Bacillus solimangrovi TaxID=1305675 RepID=A0A1E5LE80_9BACI|nr:S-methyl-5-thioribose-1-phosphate isomerase [Bacillus solimangrovi]OEH92376.1 S-methyl-5-thioribose-1-phosphate isomerase [Bacillus solimangrovi]